MIRVATWNVEWFSALFDSHDRLLADGKPSRRYRITRRDQAQAIADVLRRLDADLVIVIEAPNSGSHQSTVRALQGFARSYRLRQTAAMIGFANETEQEIAALFDPLRIALCHDPQGDRQAPRFDGPFRWDVDTDGRAETFTFNKPPLEAAVRILPEGPEFRLIGVHAKSKNTHGAKSRAEELAEALANRREHLAQCIWLRQRIEAHLDRRDPLIVLGDFNDGPGLDGFEKVFGRSGLEVVLGSADGRRLEEPHAATRLDPRQGFSLSSARFYHAPLKRYINCLLDYVMVSPALAEAAALTWRIWHPFDDPVCYGDRDLREALLTASDHFPVSLDLDFSPGPPASGEEVPHPR